jgi:hypothetical protein
MTLCPAEAELKNKGNQKNLMSEIAQSLTLKQEIRKRQRIR